MFLRRGKPFQYVMLSRSFKALANAFLAARSSGEGIDRGEESGFAPRHTFQDHEPLGTVVLHDSWVGTPNFPAGGKPRDNLWVLGHRLLVGSVHQKQFHIGVL